MKNKENESVGQLSYLQQSVLLRMKPAFFSLKFLFCCWGGKSTPANCLLSPSFHYMSVGNWAWVILAASASTHWVHNQMCPVCGGQGLVCGQKGVGAVAVSSVPHHYSFRYALRGFLNSHKSAAVSVFWALLKLTKMGSPWISLVECLPSIHTGLGVLTPAQNTCGEVLHALDPSIQEVEMGGSRIQSQPRPHT